MDQEVPCIKEEVAISPPQSIEVPEVAPISQSTEATVNSSTNQNTDMQTPQPSCSNALPKQTKPRYLKQEFYRLLGQMCLQGARTGTDPVYVSFSKFRNRKKTIPIKKKKMRKRNRFTSKFNQMYNLNSPSTSSNNVNNSSRPQ